MGFPGVKGVDKAKHYKVNKVYYTQNLMDEPEELDDEDEYSFSIPSRKVSMQDFTKD